MTLTSARRMGSASFHFLRELLRESTAIVLEDDQRYLVEGRLLPLVVADAVANLDALVDRMRKPEADELRRRVVDALLTNETSFFRDEHPWDALRGHILPEIFQRCSVCGGGGGGGGNVSIWSAACSSGQEPYSLALLIREYLCREAAPLQIAIRGTDISGTMITRARLGQFNQVETARGLPARLRDKYFQRVGDRWQIDTALRQSVRFERVNLASSWPPGPLFHLVLLRNVLIYFSHAARADIMRRLARRVVPGGYLLLGAAEVSVVDESLGFERVTIGRTTLHRKS